MSTKEKLIQILPVDDESIVGEKLYCDRNITFLDPIEEDPIIILTKGLQTEDSWRINVSTPQARLKIQNARYKTLLKMRAIGISSSK